MGEGIGHGGGMQLLASMLGSKREQDAMKVRQQMEMDRELHSDERADKHMQMQFALQKQGQEYAVNKQMEMQKYGMDLDAQKEMAKAKMAEDAFKRQHQDLTEGLQSVAEINLKKYGTTLQQAQTIKDPKAKAQAIGNAQDQLFSKAENWMSSDNPAIITQGATLHKMLAQGLMEMDKHTPASTAEAPIKSNSMAKEGLSRGGVTETNGASDPAFAGLHGKALSDAAVKQEDALNSGAGATGNFLKAAGGTIKDALTGSLPLAGVQKPEDDSSVGKTLSDFMAGWK